MRAKVLRWGNSYGIRIKKADAERLGLREGDEVVLDVKARPGQRVDVSKLPNLHLGGLAGDHDEVDWSEPRG